jgi:hypothetical protein
MCNSIKRAPSVTRAIQHLLWTKNSLLFITVRAEYMKVTPFPSNGNPSNQNARFNVLPFHLTFWRSRVRTGPGIAYLEWTHSSPSICVYNQSTALFTVFVRLKIKIRFSLYMPWKHKRSVSIAPLILNLGIRQRWVVSLRPRPLDSRRKGPLTSFELEARLAPQSVWTFWRKFKFIIPAWARNQNCRKRGP